MTQVSGGAAYKQLRLPKDGISQAMQYWGGEQNKRQAAEKLANERDGIRKTEAKNKWETDYGYKPEDFIGEHTGFQTYDDMLLDTGFHIRDEYIKVYDEASKVRGKDPEALRKAELRMKSLKGDFKRIKNADSMIADDFKSFQQAVSEGKVSKASKKYERIMKPIVSRNAKLRYGNDGVLRWIGQDSNGVKFAEDFNGLTDRKIGWFEPVDYSGKTGMINNLTALAGKYDREKIVGGKIIKESLWGNNVAEPEFKDMIRTTLTDEKTADLYNRFFDNDFELDDNITEDIKNKVVDRVFADVKNNYDQKYSETNRGLNVKEKLKENARNRAVQRQGQKDAMHRHHDNLALGREKLAKQNSKLSPKEQELSIRRYDINQAIQNKDVASFKSGSFEYNGKTYEAKDAQIPRGTNKMIITTTKGTKIPVVLEERALNEMFNNYESKKLGYDSVMSVPENQYRVERKGNVSALKDVLSDYRGDFIISDNKVIKELRKIYGDRFIKDDWKIFDDNTISVKGKSIDLNDSDAEDQIEKAMGSKTSSNTKAADLIKKYSKK